jgi:hypothetical protein
MDMAIPPLFVYVVGLALVVGGIIRLVKYGRYRPHREVADDDPARARARRWHFKFGIVWMLMGLGLIVSTALTLRSKSPGGAPPARPGDLGSAAPPTIRFQPAAVPDSPPATPATNAAPPEGR